MNLWTRVLILYLCIAILVLVLIGGVLPSTLASQNLNRISGDSINQLKHIDFALTNFIEEAKYDILELSLNEEIRSPDDSKFTNFLNTSEESFQYSIGDQEHKIIEILKGYQISHPYVSSVYMGRENGAFVRSYPRAHPTAYDPRERPWYIFAKEHPKQVVVTDPYQAVTTPDVNIGIESVLINQNGTIFGVIGADITLVNLTRYISSIGRVGNGEMILVDKNGMILASHDSNQLFSNISYLLENQTTAFLTTKEGVLVLNGRYLIYYTSPELGWKIGSFIPFATIEQKINDSIQAILIFVIIALLLLSVFSLLILNRTVIQPITSLTQISRRISETGDLDQKIDIESSGEIETLANSFKAMVDKIHVEEQGRKQALTDIEAYRDHLEELVANRTRELALARDAAESADRLKSAFLATMSHELRTPLNSIIGFSGILLQELAGPLNEEQKKQLGMVSNSADHLLALINDILDISKVEAGQLTLSIEPVDILAVIRKVIRTMEPLAKKKHIQFIQDIETENGMIRGDSRRLEQVLLNLLSNAIKFTEQGSVTIKCISQKERVEISVIDTGIGIEKTDIEKIFTPFRQVDTGLTRKYEGTGLGLSITKKMVELMNGIIKVDSKPGIGSTFTVSFPRERVES